MATLDSLKSALRQTAKAMTLSSTQSLSELQYRAGYEILMQGSSHTICEDFIIPQLSLLLAPLFDSRTSISVLEVGPGPKSVLGQLPNRLRRKIKRYTAYEPNNLFATDLEEWLCSTSVIASPFPCLEGSADVRRGPFVLDAETGYSPTKTNKEEFDVILFCHSMYDMRPKHKFIERALEMLCEHPEDGLVAIFHREGNLQLEGLSCYRTASSPTSVVCLRDDDAVLDCFASFIAGFVVVDVDVREAVQAEWRKVCRALGCRDKAYPNCVLFSSPEIMVAFNRHATALPQLMAHVPLANKDNRIKNREARLRYSTSTIRPTKVEHVRHCVRWALNHGFGLTVIGGSHSGHCIWPHVVSIDMGAFDQLHIVKSGEIGESRGEPTSDTLIIAGAGCNVGNIVRKTMAAGLTVPLGARPGVGAGLWLLGGIGHLARLHGLACDAIVGAVMVSVASSQVLVVGQVPSQHQPAGAVHPENENDLLWAIRGAGTNFGIVISVTFKAYVAPNYLVRNSIVPLRDNFETQKRLSDFNEYVAKKLPRNCSVDAYLYWDSGKLHLGMSLFESSTTSNAVQLPMPISGATILGPEDKSKSLDSVELFEAEMYMSGMHGGHGGGKTSSFKRCLFLKNIGEVKIADILVAAIETRPSPHCYLHLLHGGGAIADVKDDATAFGCRDWDFACVVTGVWPRNLDGTEVARLAVQWVYRVAGDLLPLSSGAYGADLGPDPRDAALANKAFGPNGPRLARLKHIFDPGNVLAYACPLPKAPMEPKLIILVTGESCAGKDYCAEIWVSMFNKCRGKQIKARAVSISDTTKQEYAAATGADLELLLSDRAYKEQHRPALSAYFHDQVRQRPRLPEEHFLSVVYGSMDVDVLLITGMRDEAPVAAMSHLVPDCRLLEVNVKASKETRQVRRGFQTSYDAGDDSKDNHDSRDSNDCPSFVFNNSLNGSEAARRFLERSILPLLHEDLQRLTGMIRSVPNFPCTGIFFRHVLDISQQPGGLVFCTSLLERYFRGDWDKVNAVASCEAGGFVYASALAARVNVPLVLIREAGKLPPPTVSVCKSSSHITSSTCGDSTERRIEMGQNLVHEGMSVVVVDDVLATGETLCAVLQLLHDAGVGVGDISVMVVAEFPIHRGRERLRQRGFDRAHIQSLLVFGGA